MSVAARQLARESTTMDISNWRACSEFTRRSNVETAARGLNFDYHCIKGYSNVFELGKFWAPDEEDMKILAGTGADLSASPLIRAQALSTRGFLLASEGNSETAKSDFRTALGIARGAHEAERQQMEWIMTNSEGISTGRLLDNIMSEISRRLEGLDLTPVPSPSAEDKMLHAMRLSAEGKWRSSADFFQRAYEASIQEGQTLELGQAAFSFYIDAFRTAHVAPAQEDMEFMERRPDTAIWQLDEAILWAESPSEEERERYVTVPDVVYGGLRRMNLGRIMDTVVEDATAGCDSSVSGSDMHVNRSLLTVTGPIPEFPGFGARVFAPQERALMHLHASTSQANNAQQHTGSQARTSNLSNSVGSMLASVVVLIVLLMLAVPVTYGVFKLIRRKAKRYYSMLCKMVEKFRESLSAPRAKSTLAKLPKPKASATTPPNKGKSPAVSNKTSTRRRAASDPDRNSQNGVQVQVVQAHQQQVQPPNLTAAEIEGTAVGYPIVTFPKQSPKPFSDPFKPAAAPSAAERGSGNDDEEAGKCKVCFDAECERGFFHGGSVHTGICAECADAVMDTPQPLCPFCRSPVEACVQIFS
eukprot:gene28485-31639_t